MGKTTTIQVFDHMTKKLGKQQDFHPTFFISTILNFGQEWSFLYYFCSLFKIINGKNFGHVPPFAKFQWHFLRTFSFRYYRKEIDLKPTRYRFSTLMFLFKSVLKILENPFFILARIFHFVPLAAKAHSALGLQKCSINQILGKLETGKVSLCCLALFQQSLA